MLRVRDSSPGREACQRPWESTPSSGWGGGWGGGGGTGAMSNFLIVFTYHRHTLISHLGVLCRGVVVTEVCRHS